MFIVGIGPFIPTENGRFNPSLNGHFHPTRTAYYTDSIVAVDYTTGEKGIGIGTMAGYDSEPEVDYAFSAIKSDSFFCGAFQGGNGDTSFGGVYNKISSSAPERNQ